MPANQRDVAAESAASVASLQEFVHGFQMRQLKTFAASVTPIILSASLKAIARQQGRR